MAEGSMKGLMVVLDLDTWQQVFPFFSDEAKVVGMEAPWASVPHQLDEAVATYRWPQPPVGVTVTVNEPDDAGFRVRTRSSALEIVELDMTSADIVVEDPDMGSMESVETPCPTCKADDLWVESSAQARDILKAYVDENRLSKRQEAKVSVVRCASCCDTFLDGVSEDLVAYGLQAS